MGGATPLASTEGAEASSALGSSLAVADLEGDGVPEVATGAPYVDGPTMSDVGALFIWQPLEDDSLEVATGDTAGGALGSAVVATPDRNGDGIADLLLGAPGAGQVVVLLSPFAEAQVIPGPTTGDRFGAAVAAGNDVNIVGAPLDGDAAAGAAYVTNVATGETHALHGEAIDIGGAGGAVLAGDFDADGVDDLVVGAVGVSAPDEGYAGATYLVFGPLLEDLSLSQADMVIRGQKGSYSGYSLAGGFDNDGDGRDDLLVGSLGDGGEVSLVSSLAQGTWDLHEIAAATLRADGTTVFGAAVAVATDPDGVLVVVGDPMADNGTNEVGSASFFRGPLDGTELLADTLLWGDVPYGQFGFSVGLAAADSGLAAVGAPHAGAGRVDVFALDCQP